MIEDFILKTENITKEFSGDIVLKGINLGIYKGEFITILGPSGCGKTTFLKIISGIYQPSAGELFLEGKNIKNKPPHKRPINTIFQNYALFPHMNIFDNIAYGLKIQKKPKEFIKHEVKKFLSLVNLQNFEHKKISELSGGQKQRVAMARALINNPKILLLDEPMAALDVKLRKYMQNNLKKIQKDIGITFISVTHDREEALSLSDRIVIFNEGVIEQIGAPEEIYNKPENSWVASFIGEANIIYDGIILTDNLISFDNMKFECIASGFGENERSIDILIRPEDIELLPKNTGFFNGKIISKLFKGLFWEVKVQYKKREYSVHTINDKLNIGDSVAMKWDKEQVHIMWKAFS